MDRKTQEVLFSSGSGEHRTPQDLFDILHQEFSFVADVAATEENALLPYYFTEENSAFANRWYNRNFCNPPYGTGVGSWVSNAIKESNLGNLVVMLLAARVGTKWFHEVVATAHEIRFIKGRLTFRNQPTSAPFPSMIVVWYGTYDPREFVSPRQSLYYWDTWKLKG